MTEPLSDVKIKDIEEELKINTVCPARFGAYLSSLIISHRLLQQRVTALEEESRQWEKENLVKLIKERDELEQEVAKLKAELNGYTF